MGFHVRISGRLSAMLDMNPKPSAQAGYRPADLPMKRWKDRTASMRRIAGAPLSILICVLLFSGACTTASPSGPETTASTETAETSGIPELKGRVNDYADVLTERQEYYIAEISRKLEEDTGAQLVILTVSTTGRESIEDFSLRVMRAWKIGRKDYDDGSAIVLAVQDRRVRIELGYGTNRFFTNEMAQQIIDEKMIPFFKRQDFYAGLLVGAGQMARIIREETPESWKP
ncbi:MAG: hypothetical protein CMN76_20135 [Spirochaetaceae bacterium]|nr:hypothetical protein [Spirochaetaceae bacterium]|tara:strand:+ start:23772 stop:24461 length:690 start_codon:yes stop_codon:yes gene_type:complete